MDRRDFVRTTTATIGGLSFVGQPRIARAQPSGRDPIRVGLIGCGGRGTGAAVQALSTDQDVQLVAMGDAFADNVENSYQALTTFEDVDLTPRINVPPEHRYSGFDAYERVIPHADVIILATPPGFRPMHFEAAVHAGKHVFMEKPVATDSPGVRRVLESAARAKADGLNVVVGLQRHYQTIYQEWVDRMHAGMIGEITLGRVYWNSGGVWVRE
ncbi:MAG: Gfo/Idh/MocA family protein, partial [Longimicrobiales bacterium]